MSSYSDWKCGALTDDEYDFVSRREAAEDKYLEDKMYAEVYEDDYDEEEDDDE